MPKIVKKIKKIQIVTWGWDDFEGSLSDIIFKLQEINTTTGLRNVTCVTNYAWDEQSRRTWDFFGEREETDEEYRSRMERNRKDRATKKKNKEIETKKAGAKIDELLKKHPTLLSAYRREEGRKKNEKE